MLGGQDPVEEEMLPRTFAFDLARQHRGSFVYLEHRFYGFSGSNNLTATKLEFLQVDQALADIDEFIKYIRNEVHNDPDAQIILMGWRYAGSLAVWYQHRYPNVVSGVWASSAPVLAEPNYDSFMPNIGAVIRNIGGDECFQRLQIGILRAESLYALEQHDQLEREFFVCNASATESDLRVMTTGLALEFGILVQNGL